MKSLSIRSKLWRSAAIAAAAWAIAPLALADPTRPPAARSDPATGSPKPQGVSPPAPRANLIIRGRERAIALIDGQQVRIGDRVGEARLVRIDTDRLVLSDGVALEVSSHSPTHPTGNRP